MNGCHLYHHYLLLKDTNLILFHDIYVYIYIHSYSITLVTVFKKKVGRNRLIPEYTFMDPRAVGLWDMEKISVMEEAIWAMDHDEAGKHGDVSLF